MENLIKHIHTQLFSSTISSHNINGKSLSKVPHAIYHGFPYWGDRGSLLPPPPGKILLPVDSPTSPTKFLFLPHQKLTPSHFLPPHPSCTPILTNVQYSQNARMFLALKKVQIIKITPPQVFTTQINKSLMQNFWLLLPPLYRYQEHPAYCPYQFKIWPRYTFNWMWIVAFVKNGVLLSGYSYLNFLQCQILFFDQNRT